MKSKMMFRRVMVPLSLLASLSAGWDAQAQDASLGCKILLCAAATNPDWTGIPYCLAPMGELFKILKSGGDWPTCPEAGASLSQSPLRRSPSLVSSLAQAFDNDARRFEGENIASNQNASTCFVSGAVAARQSRWLQTLDAASVRPTRDLPYFSPIGVTSESAWPISWRPLGNPLPTWWAHVAL